MVKLFKIVGMTALVIGTALLPLIPAQAQNADPCDGPRNEFLEGWCS